LEATQAKAVPHISLTIDFAKGDWVLCETICDSSLI
jgi:hypothetical protein